MEQRYIPQKDTTRITLCIGGGLLVLLLVALIFFRMGGTTQDERTSLEEEVHATSTPDLFAMLSLEAGAAYVFDVKNDEVLYEKNAEAQLPLASLTKIMTALVAEGVFSEEESIPITSVALAEEGNYGFTEGQWWRLQDLLDLLLVSSSNDAAAAIAHAFDQKEATHGAFVDRMNQTADSLGLTQTYFLNATGLDVNNDTYASAYGSARDVAHLLSYTLKRSPSLLEATEATVIERTARDGGGISLQNTNEAHAKIPWLVMGKTGFTDTAGGNLAVVFEAGIGHPVAAVVLGSSKEGRFADMETLVATVFEHMHQSTE